MRLRACFTILSLALASPASSYDLVPSPEYTSGSETAERDDGVKLAQRVRPYRRPPPPPPPPRIPQRVVVEPAPNPKAVDSIFRPSATSNLKPPYRRVLPIAGALAVLGTHTTNPAEAKFYLTQREGEIVLQSNYSPPGTSGEIPRAVILRSGGEPDVLQRGITAALSDMPPKLLTKNNIGVPKHPARNHELLISEELIAVDGRPAVDVSGARQIKLVRNGKVVTTGAIETLNAGNPPPPLIETLSGCCFKGQPPGKRVEIRTRLERTQLSTSNTRVMSLVVDTATTSALRNSPVLGSISRTDRPGAGRWGDMLAAELSAASGQNLILITHVLDNRVVVESPRGDHLFDIGVAELQTMADQHGVNLILLGCETSATMNQAPLVVGVIGKYNTAKAVRRLSDVLVQSRNGAEFMDALATQELQIVAQPGNWSANAASGTLYGRARSGPEKWIRLMRVWFLGGDDNG